MKNESSNVNFNNPLHLLDLVENCILWIIDGCKTNLKNLNAMNCNSHRPFKNRTNKTRCRNYCLNANFIAF